MSAWAGPLSATTGVTAAQPSGPPMDLARLHTLNLGTPPTSAATTATPATPFAIALRDVPARPTHTGAAEAVGQKFEATVLMPLIAHMLPPKDNPVWGGQSGAIWRSLYAERLAEALAQSGSVGIAPLIDQMIGAAPKTGGPS
ncbi:MAG: rod-binding protein [Pseudomonadota bacterium]